MCTITARDFRQNMKTMLDRASAGEDVVVSRGDEYFMVVKVNMVPEVTPELETRLAQAREQIACGEIGATLSSAEDIEAYLQNL